MSLRDKKIVVSGMGIISSIGNNISEFKESLKYGVSKIGYLDKAINNYELGAYIKEFKYDLVIEKFKDKIDQELKKNLNMLARVPFAQKVTIGATLEAYISAKLNEKPVNSERMGIIVSGSNISQGYHDEIREKYSDQIDYVTPSYALHYSDFDHVGVLSDIFKINGEGFTVGGNSASGNVAIIKAFQMIQLGVADICLVVGPVTEWSKYEKQSFKNLGAMGGKSFQENPNEACRPFEINHEGFIYGQASACIVIESLRSAEKRGILPLGEIVSGSIVLDGNRLSNPSIEGETRVMKSVLEKANLECNKIDYINAHGTSTPMGDDVELEAIKNVFGCNMNKTWINSTKGLTGHCLNSASIVEAIASIIQMNEGFIHPNANLKTPVEAEYKFSRDKFINSEIKYTMSNAFGFGGINTSIILKRMG